MMYNTDVQIVLEAVIELVSVDMCPFTRVGKGQCRWNISPFLVSHHTNHMVEQDVSVIILVHNVRYKAQLIDWN